LLRSLWIERRSKFKGFLGLLWLALKKINRMQTKFCAKSVEIWQRFSFLQFLTILLLKVYEWCYDVLRCRMLLWCYCE
jgi:uncharacterized membrane protein